MQNEKEFNFYHMLKWQVSGKTLTSYEIMNFSTNQNLSFQQIVNLSVTIDVSLTFILLKSFKNPHKAEKRVLG